MRYALVLLAASIASAQFFPFPGPGRASASGGGGGGGATFSGESHENSQSAADTTISIPGTLNVAAGDLIVVAASAVENDVGRITGVVCGADTLTLAVENYASAYSVTAWYKQNASANAAADCTATVVGTGGQGTFRNILAANWSGVLTTGALKNSSCNSVGCNVLAATSTDRTAQNVTTTTANALLVAVGVDWNGGVTHTATNGYTKRVNSDTMYLLDKNVSATGSYPGGTFSTVSTTDQYFSIFLVFGTL